MSILNANHLRLKPGGVLASETISIGDDLPPQRVDYVKLKQGCDRFLARHGACRHTTRDRKFSTIAKIRAGKVPAGPAKVFMEDPHNRKFIREYERKFGKA